jgi:hypothetical protein
MCLPLFLLTCLPAFLPSFLPSFRGRTVGQEVSRRPLTTAEDWVRSQTIPSEICSDFSGSGTGKGKVVPLQTWSGPEGSRKLRFPDYMTTAQDGGEVSLTHRPPLPPGNTPGTYCC